MGPSIREATEADAAEFARIHNEGIEDRQATFRTEARDAEAALENLRTVRICLVAEGDRDGEVIGWAVAGPYTDTAPYYEEIAEAAVYVSREARGAGVGRRLLEALCERAPGHGIHKLTAKIFTTNTASAELFKRCGFREVGVHLRHGRLDGEWKDVLVVERSFAL
jgi:phosphinothricin acetyltransferase